MAEAPRPAREPAAPDGAEGSPARGQGAAGVAVARGASGSARAYRLNEPRPALVHCRFDGTPQDVNRQTVAVVREEWRVVDRWWTDEPVSRRYFELVLESGQNVVVFRDEERSCWFSQRGV